MKLRRRKVLHRTVPPEDKEGTVESVVVTKLFRRKSGKLSKIDSEADQSATSDTTKLRKLEERKGARRSLRQKSEELSENNGDVEKAASSGTTKLQKLKERRGLSTKLMNHAGNLDKSGVRMQQSHIDSIESSAESTVSTNNQPQRSRRKQPKLNSKRTTFTKNQCLAHREEESNSPTISCFAVLHENDKVSELEKNKQKKYKSSIACRSTSDRLSNNTSIQSVNELMSVLREEFGTAGSTVNQSKDRQSNFFVIPCSVVFSEEDNVSEHLKGVRQYKSSDNQHTITISDGLDSPDMNEDVSVEGVKELTSLHTTKKSPPTKQAGDSTLASWLATAQSPISKTKKVLESKLAHTSDSSLRMKRLNTRTPLHSRKIDRLASTPHLSSPSDTNCEEDLFGFENLLKPVIDLPLNFSPIPNPSIRRSLRKKISPLYAPKNATEQLDGILDITTSHFNAKPKKKTRRKQGNNNNEEVIDLSNVCLFEDASDEFQYENNIKEVGDYCFDEEESPSKPKRYRQNNKPAPKIHFNIENQLPWKEIMEHELVIESV